MEYLITEMGYVVADLTEAPWHKLDSCILNEVTAFFN
jgi:hypothetical protein